MKEQKFSDQLEQWLHGKSPKTLDSLEQVFRERSFAIIILLLMFLPSLPLPTGGITHVFEIISMLLALEMIAGRTTLWVPKRWRHRKLGQRTVNKALPFIMRRIRWFEKFSRPRLKGMLDNHNFLRLAGLLLFVFSLAAFLSPPFSGLDTLPSLGAVVIALSLILGDTILFIAGCIVGLGGIALIIGLGTAVTSVFKHIF
ncbi:MAG: exopolysaccharide biosynthesis protein [Candidatus Saccharibacteria bacterium]|nr:exopolysaccharide biosynthesis protein [Candidatus Saccharibacteria bacterium]